MKFSPLCSRILGIVALLFTIISCSFSSYVQSRPAEIIAVTIMFFAISTIPLFPLPQNLNLRERLNPFSYAMVKTAASIGLYFLFVWFGKEVKITADLPLMNSSVAFFFVLLAYDLLYDFEDEVGICEAYAFAGFGLMLDQKRIPIVVVVIVGICMLTLKNYLRRIRTNPKESLSPQDSITGEVSQETRSSRRRWLNWIPCLDLTGELPVQSITTSTSEESRTGQSNHSSDQDPSTRGRGEIPWKTGLSPLRSNPVYKPGLTSKLSGQRTPKTHQDRSTRSHRSAKPELPVGIDPPEHESSEGGKRIRSNIGAVFGPPTESVELTTIRKTLPSHRSAKPEQTVGNDPPEHEAESSSEGGKRLLRIRSNIAKSEISIDDPPVQPHQEHEPENNGKKPDLTNPFLQRESTSSEIRIQIPEKVEKKRL